MRSAARIRTRLLLSFIEFSASFWKGVRRRARQSLVLYSVNTELIVMMGFRSIAVLCVSLAGAITSAQANPVVEWNGIMLETVAGQSSVNEPRLGAITQLAVFEAVNSITREYQPYLGTIKPERGASAEAAAVAAAHRVLKHYFPAKASTLDEAREKSMAQILDGPAKMRGTKVGEAAADAMIELRSADGATPAEFYLPTSSRPGAWQPTPSCSPNGGAFKHWANVQPFGIVRSNQFKIPGPPSLKSKRYARAFNELKKYGSAESVYRPADRSDVARFYASVLTIGTWNPAVTQVATAQGRSMTHTARALALVNMALSDAMISVFNVKYKAPFWRPEIAIRNGDLDGNKHTTADPNFVPFVTTPCHPSYASAHGSTSTAARTVLEKIYGRGNHNITLSSPNVPGVILQYRRFDQISRDIDDARVYGGIHWRFDQEGGAKLGKQVGEYVYRKNLTPRKHW